MRHTTTHGIDIDRHGTRARSRAPRASAPPPPKAYNEISTQKMDLIFFRDFVEHVSRMTRVLRQPRGNAVLVGIGGSGKRSVSRLAIAVACRPFRNHTHVSVA